MSSVRTVLLLTDLFAPIIGGLERHVDELATYLTAEGYRVHVATCSADPSASDPSVVTHVVETAIGRLVRFDDPLRPYHPPTADPLAHRALGRLIDDIKPDIIHGHSWLAHSVPRNANVPLVLTAHDYGLICQRRSLYDNHSRRCSGPRGLGCVSCGVEQYGAAKSLVGAAGVAWSRRRQSADHIIAVSHAVADHIRGYVNSPITVIHNWEHPTPKSALRPAAVPDGDFVMYAGDRGPHKGIDVLVRAWGSQDPPALPLFLATTRPLEHPVPLNVVRARLRPAEMAGAWSAAVMAVVPSVWDEPFSLVTLEALSAGTPVVASAVGGLVELIRDGETGMLIPPGDPESLRSAVRGLLADIPARQRMSENARRAAAAYAPEHMIPQIVAVYEELIRR